MGTSPNNGSPESLAFSPDETNVTVIASRVFNLHAATGVVMLVGLAAIVADAPKLALGFIFANP